MKIKGLIFVLMSIVTSCVFAQSSSMPTQTTKQDSFLNKQIASVQQHVTNTASQVTALVQKNKMLQENVTLLQQKLKVMKQLYLPSSTTSIMLTLIIVLVLLLALFIVLLCGILCKSKKKNISNPQFESEGLELIAGENVNDTKLDLARAYIDMNEKDNAKILLKEVLSDGDASQKNEAKALLNELKE